MSGQAPINLLRRIQPGPCAPAARRSKPLQRPKLAAGTYVRVTRLAPSTPKELLFKFGFIVLAEENPHGFKAVAVAFLHWDKGHNMAGILPSTNCWYLSPDQIESTTIQPYEGNLLKATFEEIEKELNSENYHAGS